ncbi:MAG: hypothetical protein ACYTGW_04585 [Planctomycetota bacterium]|jgi:hypothetical protein
MRRSRRHLPAALLLVAASTMLQSCLTRALWDVAEEAPPLVEGMHACQVHDVRGRLHHGSLDNQLLISFSTPQVYETLRHQRTYTEATPGMFKLVPPERGGGDWHTLPGSWLFQPEGWGFRIYHGEHLADTGVNASLWFHGWLQPEKVCRALPAHQVPTTVREQRGLRIPDSQGDLLDRCLVTFTRHNWLQLATGEKRWTDHRRTPLAFVDAQARVVSLEQIRNRIAGTDPATARRFLAGCALIARLDGPWQDQRSLHVEIPLAVLAQGKHLQLTRGRNKTYWKRTQVWHGEETQKQPSMDALAKVHLPLDSEVFAYIDAREAHKATVLPTVARVLLTPAALAADFVLMHSIYFKKMLEAIKAGQPRGPFGKRGK